MNKVKLTISGLTTDIESGLTRKEMCEKYGLPSTQLSQAIKKAGLQGRVLLNCATMVVSLTSR